MKSKSRTGETYAVILPPYEMSDDQLYSLIQAFRQLEIPCRPDDLNTRNCIRERYPRQNRYLTDEENERKENIRRMYIRGMLDKETPSSNTACITVNASWEPSYTVWLYPYRSLTDEELTSIVLAEDTVWETDPDQLERAARKAARSILRLSFSPAWKTGRTIISVTRFPVCFPSGSGRCLSGPGSAAS